MWKRLAGGEDGGGWARGRRAARRGWGGQGGDEGRRVLAPVAQAAQRVRHAPDHGQVVEGPRELVVGVEAREEAAGGLSRGEELPHRAEQRHVHLARARACAGASAWATAGASAGARA